MIGQFSRRDFIRRGLLTAASLTALAVKSRPSSQESLERKGIARKVIIIGAGLAGLSAAYELGRAGHQVVVLEARMRAGGRVYTLREPSPTGSTVKRARSFFPNRTT
jgi:monoamine oxidase